MTNENVIKWHIGQASGVQLRNFIRQCLDRLSLLDAQNVDIINAYEEEIISLQNEIDEK